MISHLQYYIVQIHLPNFPLFVHSIESACDNYTIGPQKTDLSDEVCLQKDKRKNMLGYTNTQAKTLLSKQSEKHYLVNTLKTPTHIHITGQYYSSHLGTFLLLSFLRRVPTGGFHKSGRHVALDLRSIKMCISQILLINV